MDIIFSTLFDTNLPKMKILRYTDHMDMTIYACNPLMTSQELYRRVKVRIKYSGYAYIHIFKEFAKQGC